MRNYLDSGPKDLVNILKEDYIIFCCFCPASLKRCAIVTWSVIEERYHRLVDVVSIFRRCTNFLC